MATITYSWAECQDCFQKWDNRGGRTDCHILGRKHHELTGHKVITEVHIVNVFEEG
jgi:hypothetical protein